MITLRQLFPELITIPTQKHNTRLFAANQLADVYMTNGEAEDIVEAEFLAINRLKRIWKLFDEA